MVKNAEGPSMIISSGLFKPESRKENIPWDIRLNDLRFSEKLGDGVYGNSSKGVWNPLLSNIEIECTIKQFRYQNLTEEFLAIYRDEASKLFQLDHPYICKFLGISTQEHLYTITTFVPGVSLHHFLQHKMDTSFVIKVAQQVAEGVNYLHSNGIIHQDLKPKNILLDDAVNVKLNDYGFSFVKNEIRGSGYIISPEYDAPEILLNRRDFDEKVDVYSFAIIFNQLFTQQQPFAGLQPRVIVASVTQNSTRPQVSPQTPNPCLRIIQACWQQDPFNRPPFSKLSLILNQPVDQLLAR